jgi:hypothetical protein
MPGSIKVPSEGRRGRRKSSNFRFGMTAIAARESAVCGGTRCLLLPLTLAGRKSDSHPSPKHRFRESRQGRIPGLSHMTPPTQKMGVRGWADENTMVFTDRTRPAFVAQSGGAPSCSLSLRERVGVRAKEKRLQLPCLSAVVFCDVHCRKEASGDVTIRSSAVLQRESQVTRIVAPGTGTNCAPREGAWQSPSPQPSSMKTRSRSSPFSRILIFPWHCGPTSARTYSFCPWHFSFRCLDLMIHATRAKPGDRAILLSELGPLPALPMWVVRRIRADCPNLSPSL